MNIKGVHNHEVNIKRNKPMSQLIGRGNRGMPRIAKVESSNDAHDQYENVVFVEEDDESINV